MQSDPLDAMELFQLWLIVSLTTLVGLSARVARKLFDVAEDPPEDTLLFKHWKRRRHWMIFSEISAVPAIATGWISAGLYWNLSYPFIVLGSMASGALGFGFLLHAVQTWVNKKADKL